MSVIGILSDRQVAWSVDNVTVKNRPISQYIRDKPNQMMTLMIRPSTIVIG